MATLTIRNVNEGVKERLRVRAAHGRSMEAEARAILSGAVACDRDRPEPNLAEAKRHTIVLNANVLLGKNLSDFGRFCRSGSLRRGPSMGRLVGRVGIRLMISGHATHYIDSPRTSFSGCTVL
jgi:plasmid stability protein